MLDKGRPMAPAEAYGAIVAADLYTFNTDDPVSVVRAQIRRRCLGLDFPSALATKCFRATNDGRYTLIDHARVVPDQEAPERDDVRSTLAQMLALQHEHEREVRTRVLEALKNLEPSAFERFAGRLLTAYGFEQVVVTRPMRDGGIDGHGQLRIGLTTVSVAFQCKRYRDKPIGPDAVESFRGRTSGRHEQGYYFTTSRFTREAIDAQRRPGAVPIVLFDGERIVDIMFEKAFGVGFRNLRIPELNIDLVLEE
ncbi:restriction endonuclease [Methylobacterium oryzihabitans]|uniref:Restriction endonuclease n=1 Tax=Methylobacterium oryzihabitans TaxID=2499852 RepID=A0A437P8B5_9HYPH|nr:restriction endonuclease [Methylobacterium oryzihabitans]RVU18494.1 restriction endonuclease [Methylobacterium oryzihabitans]